MHQPCQDQFLFPRNFFHITLEAFVRFEANHISKTLIFVFHPSHHQVTKSDLNTKITKLGYAPTMPRSIPFAPKLIPHHFAHITLEAFVSFEPSHISKTMIFVFHPTLHQVTKLSQNTKITKLS